VSAAWGQEYVLTLSCQEKPGIVHAVSSYLVQHSANILASQQYGEAPDGRFFMRVHFAVPPGAQLGELRRDFAAVAEASQMSWQRDTPRNRSSRDGGTRRRRRGGPNRLGRQCGRPGCGSSAPRR
jgi:formyltetrahydrofolate hydrolase